MFPVQIWKLSGRVWHELQPSESQGAMSDPHRPAATTPARQTGLRYVIATVALNLIWEIAQMPFYTLWLTGSGPDITYAILHCTVGDMLIASVSLTAARVILRARHWPEERALSVAVITIALALAYTVFSEWWNVEVLQAWAYRNIMPRLPLLGTGLSPLLQWLVVPLLAFWIVSPARLVRSTSQ